MRTATPSPNICQAQGCRRPATLRVQWPLATEQGPDQRLDVCQRHGDQYATVVFSEREQLNASSMAVRLKIR